VSIQAVEDTATLWIDHPRWWLYGVHPQFAAAFARFHTRNRFHLRMAMSLSADLEQPAYWDSELPRRQAAMNAGQAVHLVGFLRQGDDREIGCMTSFWGIEHGDFEACTISFLLDRRLEGQGLMFNALEPVVPEVIRRHKLHRVMATHLPENLRSAALLKRLGFVVEGYARDFVKVNGQWRDNVLLSRVEPTPSPEPLRADRASPPA
jgi:ribosomal-protein-alanine N-acetyltransferase